MMINPEKDPAPDGVTVLRRELAEEKNRHLRTLADFDNYRKRVERDAAACAAQGKKELAGDLLEVLDNLERALAGVTDERVRQGLQMVYRQFLDTLCRHGLEPVECVGRPFDPGEQEGAGYVEAARFPPGYVAEELSRGYRFNRELLRPAVVRVAGGR
ncbi:nucleotide exchange factor GrpE [Desulfotomaculum copahuensis]|uniref:Protein GrpE n=1 Tax=Desulfotomaculum copahuensis TaxID=1838280 RepID=A0A1B7LFB6_9FIRM|nr:nucleotide exchange factor GrpE [Desulfotomaculum copahuensis]OAT82282.1 hypothetical protein A6M21_08985 [Desulfotomaculum copahuensis]